LSVRGSKAVIVNLETLIEGRPETIYPEVYTNYDFLLHQMVGEHWRKSFNDKERKNEE
jgi:hypothetical protein